jgi:hypothetical protein
VAPSSRDAHDQLLPLATVPPCKRITFVSPRISGCAKVWKCATLRPRSLLFSALRSAEVGTNCGTTKVTPIPLVFERHELLPERQRPLGYGAVTSVCGCSRTEQAGRARASKRLGGSDCVWPIQNV